MSWKSTADAYVAAFARAAESRSDELKEKGMSVAEGYMNDDENVTVQLRDNTIPPPNVAASSWLCRDLLAVDLDETAVEDLHNLVEDLLEQREDSNGQEERAG